MRRDRIVKDVVCLAIAAALCYALSLLVSAYYEKTNRPIVESARAQLLSIPIASGDLKAGGISFINNGGPIGVSRGLSSSRSADQIIGYYKTTLGSMGWTVVKFYRYGQRRQQLTLCKAGASFNVATTPMFDKTDYSISLLRYSAGYASDPCAAAR